MPERIEREVEELLARLDTFPPKKPLGRRIRSAVTSPVRAVRNWYAGLKLPSISSGHVLLASIVIVVIAWVALDGGLQTWVLAGGILLFVGAFALSLRRQSRPPTKYWRDRPMDTDDRRRRR